MAKDDRDKGFGWKDIFWKPHKYNERKQLKTGSYLRSFCPHCDAELSTENVIRLEVIDPDGRTGWIELSPYLNVFEHKTDIQLPTGQEVHDLRCSHCHQSLVVKERRCRSCDSHVASFMVGISNTRVPFYICMRIGCHWHGISDDDETQIMLDDSNEW